MPIPTQTIVIPHPVQMSQPAVMPMPVPQGMPPSAMAPSSGAPVIPPVPQTGAGTPFPTATGPPVIPATPGPFSQPQYQRAPSSPDSSEEDMPRMPEFPSGQHAMRNFMFQRPESIVFHHHPLPTPPKDVFELPQFGSLLEDLHRPAEEVLARHRPAPIPQTMGYVLTPVGSHAHRPKKQRKGLFRTLSDRLVGKPRREHEPDAALAVPVMQQVMFTAPPGVVQTPGMPVTYGYDPAHMEPSMNLPTQAGMTPSPMFVPSPSHTPVPPPPPSKAPSPVPSARSRIYSPRQRYQSLEPIKIDLLNELANLTHLSPHNVRYKGKVFPSALHALEAQRFVDGRPDVVEQIQNCGTPDEVRAVVSHHNMFSRPDWEQVVVRMVNIYRIL